MFEPGLPKSTLKRNIGIHDRVEFPIPFLFTLVSIGGKLRRAFLFLLIQLFSILFFFLFSGRRQFQLTGYTLESLDLIEGISGKRNL